MKTRSAGMHTIREWFVLLVLACVLPAAIATILLINYSYQHERASVQRSTIETARALMQAVDRELSSAQGALLTLGRSPYLRNGDLAAFYEQSREALEFWPGSNIVLSDASGQQLINTLEPFGAPLPLHGNPRQLKQVFETGKPVISDLFQGALAHRQLITVDVPVNIGNRVAYDLSMGFFPDRLADILKKQRLPEAWPATIFDSSGVTVARTHEPERFVGKRGIPELMKRMGEIAEDTIDADTLEGIPAIVAFSRSSLSNWTVTIAVPRAVLNAQLRKSIFLVIAGTVLLLLSGMMLAKIVADRITRSVRGLVEPAIALGYGHPVITPPMHLQETADVAQALIKASELLQKRTEERDCAERAKHAIRMVKDEMEKSEILQRGIFEQAPDAILLVSASGQIVKANAEAARLFGYAAEQLLSLKAEALIPGNQEPADPSSQRFWFAAPVRHMMGSGMELLGRRSDGSMFPMDVMLSLLQSTDGALVIATIRDITERRRAEEALRQSERRFRNTLEYAPIGISIVSPDGRWLEVNSAMCELVGYSKAEMQQRTIQDLTHPDDLEKDLALARRLLNGEIRSYQLEKRYIRKDGRAVTVLLTRSLLRDDHGKPVYFIAQIEDISERKMAQEQLSALNKRLALATQAGGMGVWELDLGSQLLWWDKRMYEMHQLDSKAASGTSAQWWKCVHPDHLARVRQEFESAVNGRGLLSIEFPIIWPDNQTKVIRADALLSRDEEGHPAKLTGICWDVTDSRRQEETIKAALREKETLLKELYHRVKNNLQVITSLFNLQVHALPEGAARNALKEAADRVRAMALVHEKLYQSGNLSSIALDDYITDLCVRLGNAALASERGIRLTSKSEKIEVGLETAVPLGLLLNEVISNALKHAFPDGRHGTIVVRLAHEPDDWMKLTVTDDGIGFPPNLDITSSRTLGLNLVAALSAQLDGKLTFGTDGGAWVSLKFRLAKRAGASNGSTLLAATG